MLAFTEKGEGPYSSKVYQMTDESGILHDVLVSFPLVLRHTINLDCKKCHLQISHFQATLGYVRLTIFGNKNRIAVRFLFLSKSGTPFLQTFTDTR